MMVMVGRRTGRNGSCMSFVRSTIHLTRFKPTNEEIICLLKMKRLDPDFSVQTIKETDFYNFDPWELPWYSGIQSKESVWYFYCKPYHFKSSKRRKHRKTKSGSWKTNGKGSNMKAKNTEVDIGRKNILSSCLLSLTSIKGKAEWVMHEILIEDNPLYKEDFVVCYQERRRYNKPIISTSDDSESSHLVAADDASLKFALSPNQHLVSDRNHVAEKLHYYQLTICRYYQINIWFLILEIMLQKIFAGLEDQTPSQYLTSGYSNHAAGKTVPTVECQQLGSHYFNSTCDYINHFAEKIFSMDELQQLPSHHLTFRGQVTEHSFPGEECMLFAQFDAVQGSNEFKLQSPTDIGDDGFSGCNALDHNSFSAQEYPINREKRTSSSFDCFIDYNVLDFQFDKVQEDLNSQGNLQDKHPPVVETGNTLDFQH